MSLNSKIQLASIDYMITSTCNLNCEFCDRFSNFNLSWFEKVEQFEEDLDNLLKTVSFKSFDLMGGEPLLHPKLTDMLKISRKYMLNTFIGTFSNGFLIKDTNLIETLVDIQPSSLQISIHFKDKEQQQIIYSNIKEFILKPFSYEIIDKNNILVDKNVIIHIKDQTKHTWNNFYQIIDGKFKPFFDNDPINSYKTCGHSALLAFKGRLFKCPPISQLRPMAEKYGFLEDPDWEQYLKYTGLSFNASKEDYLEFFEKQWKPDPTLCTMCPSSPDKSEKQKIVSHKSNYYKRLLAPSS